MSGNSFHSYLCPHATRDQGDTDQSVELQMFFSLKIGVGVAYFQPFLGSLILIPSNFQAKRAWPPPSSQVSYLQFLLCGPYSSLSSLSIVKIDQTLMFLQGDTRWERYKGVQLLGCFCTFLPFLLSKEVRILPVCSPPGAGQVEQTSEQKLGWSFTGDWGFSSP